jgi:hypothetical protein
MVLLTVTASCSTTPQGTPVKLPDGDPGIGFDDLRYSARLHRVLVPGGRSGRLDLINPDDMTVTSILGFSVTGDYSGGHDDGVTSVDESPALLYATDRTSGKLLVIDPAKGAIIGSTALAASPDYVRVVASRRELWVTQPSASQVEIFRVADDGTPTHDSVVPVSNGPESMVVDETRGRAYTHRWQKSTVAIDLATRTIVAEWANGCASSRGIALDESRGFLFSGCNEGTAAVLDVAHDGRILSTLARGSGFDVIGYSPSLGHLYLAGSSCSCLVTLGVSPTGQFSFLDRKDAPSSTHCAVADDVGHAWVCDQSGGQIWRVDDSHESTLR